MLMLELPADFWIDLFIALMVLVFTFFFWRPLRVHATVFCARCCCLSPAPSTPAAAKRAQRHLQPARSFKGRPTASRHTQALQERQPLAAPATTCGESPAAAPPAAVASRPEVQDIILQPAAVAAAAAEP